MNFNKQKIATAALVISFLGVIATYSSTGFFGALLYHGFLASLVGGFADWFAVVALFRKPLGISYRTEVLKRNRARIMDEIVNFVVHDILSGDNIMRVLKQENMAELFIGYLQYRGGRARIMAAAGEIFSAWLSGIDTKKISCNITPSVKEGLFSAFEKDRVEKLLNLLLKKDKDILLFFATLCENVYDSEIVRNSLKAKIGEALEEYSKDSISRSMLIGFLDLNEDSVMKEVDDGFLKRLNEIKTGEGETYLALKAKLQSFTEDFKNSPDFEEKLNVFKEYLGKNILLEDKLDEIISSQIKSKSLKEPLEKFLIDKLEEFEQNKELQLKFDNWIKEFITEGINKHHSVIENLVRERLNQFSDEAFSDFVEEKVNDDLQIIRVNGAIVGGVLGMALYIVTYISERTF